VRRSPEFKLVQVANGTYSVHSLQYAETFHPVIGPVAEAEALYVRQLGLERRVAEHHGDFVIWDVGLGAAANALTVLHATRHLANLVELVSFDQTVEPLRFALQHAEELGYFEGMADDVSALLAQPEQPHAFRNGNQPVRWQLHVGHFPELLEQPKADQFPKPHAILFDAYSPATNPEMWTQPLFAKLFGLLDPNRPCALATYSRSTMLRVTLLLAGFYVGRGHATGEKEETTIAANSAQLITDLLDARWLKRARNSTSAEPMWTAHYRQAPLSPDSWERLKAHPQF
jgi:tRNA U34 5-methylaminomethyl-2-thiouridine-forming methyltransferase MnmC